MDRIRTCKVCELRYACDDCRILEEKLTNKLEKKKNCNHNSKEYDRS